MRLIDADELMDFPYSEGAGTEEQIMDWIEECGLSDEEDGAKMLCWKVIEGFRNVVKTAPTLPAPQWIRVEERLPGWSGDYICVSRDKNGREWVIPAEWSREMKTWFGRFGEIRNKVTHWMPLPEPPKGEKS